MKREKSVGITLQINELENAPGGDLCAEEIEVDL